MLPAGLFIILHLSDWEDIKSASSILQQDIGFHDSGSTAREICFPSRCCHSLCGHTSNFSFPASKMFYYSVASVKVFMIFLPFFVTSEWLEKYSLQVLKTDDCCIMKNIKLLTTHCVWQILPLHSSWTNILCMATFRAYHWLLQLFPLCSTFLQRFFLYLPSDFGVGSYFLLADYLAQFHCNRLTMSCLSVPQIYGNSRLRSTHINWEHYFVSVCW